MWSRGLIKPGPLELWLCSLIDDSPSEPDAIYDSALLCAAETLLSGGTSIMDHCSMILEQPAETIDACVRAYRDIGIRAFVAPLMGDLDILDCIPTSPLRDTPSTEPEKPYTCTKDEERSKFFLDTLEKAAQQHHKPSEGVSIVAGPTGIQLCSDEFFTACRDISVKYSLPRHLHLLETRSQKQLAWDKYKCSAVAHLHKLGFLNDATTCAHSIHLTPEDMDIIQETGSTLVHNPLSNLRLGSGIAPVLEYVRRGINVSFGCDGSASNDAQDLLEAIKIGSMLHNITDTDYRNWLTPISVIKMASEGAAKGVGMSGVFGSIRKGQEADICLYDLTHHVMLPRSDPLGLFVWGRPKEAITDVWVRGRRVVKDGKLTTINLDELLQRVQTRIEQYRSMGTYTSELRDALEPRYRMVMHLSK